LIVTPDSPLLVASSFVLLCLAKVLETGRGAWWLAVGAAVGAVLVVHAPRAALLPPLAAVLLVVMIKGRHHRAERAAGSDQTAGAQA